MQLHQGYVSTSDANLHDRQRFHCCWRARLSTGESSVPALAASSSHVMPSCAASRHSVQVVLFMEG